MKFGVAFSIHISSSIGTPREKDLTISVGFWGPKKKLWYRRTKQQDGTVPEVINRKLKLW